MLKYTTLKGFKLGIDMVQLMFKEITLAVVDWIGGGQDQESTAIRDDGEWTKVAEVEMKRGRFERYLELKGLGVVACGWEGEGGIKDTSQGPGDVRPGHSSR